MKIQYMHLLYIRGVKSPCIVLEQMFIGGYNHWVRVQLGKKVLTLHLLLLGTNNQIIIF